jgi:hypothetical protein
MLQTNVGRSSFRSVPLSLGQERSAARAPCQPGSILIFQRRAEPRVDVRVPALSIRQDARGLNTTREPSPRAGRNRGQASQVQRGHRELRGRNPQMSSPRYLGINASVIGFDPRPSSAPPYSVVIVYMPSPRLLSPKRHPENVAIRQDLLTTSAAVQPLRAFAEELRERRERSNHSGIPVVVPHFDPADAGVGARVLFLLEAPGPMTDTTSSTRPGSGFISVDNDDLTAQNCWLARAAAGLDSAAHWNIAPVYLGPTKNKPNAAELAAGALDLRRILPLFVDLRVVVLCGAYAKRGWARHVEPFLSGPTVISTWHPSGRGLNPAGRREDFFEAVSRAKSIAGSHVRTSTRVT